jgi:hypothetical protein
MRYSTEQVEEHIEQLKKSFEERTGIQFNPTAHIPDDNEAMAASMLQEQLEDRCELVNQLNRRKEPIVIEYYIRESYGRKLEYILDPGQRQIIQNLTRQKTIDSIIRELLRDLTGGAILWKQVFAP